MSETKTIDLTKGMIKHKQPTFHYLVTNPFEWESGDDLHELMQRFDKKGYTYWVWYVPGDKTQTAYEIRFYQPQVEGSFVLAQVEKKPKARK
jgi:hypothetical protein